MRDFHACSERGERVVKLSIPEANGLPLHVNTFQDKEEGLKSKSIIGLLFELKHTPLTCSSNPFQ